MGDMVVELLGDKDNRWHGTVRQAPEKWTAKEWRKVYGFGRGGEGMASRTDRFIDGMFSGRVNPKDGYVVVDCKDPRVKRVLEFLVPLLYPEKPTRVTITVRNTIFGALSGERPVDWGIVVKDLVQRLLSRMGSPRQRRSARTSSTSIIRRNCSFLMRRRSTGPRRPSRSTTLSLKEKMIRTAWQTWMKRRAWMTRSVRVSHPMKSGRSRSWKRPGSRNRQ